MPTGSGDLRLSFLPLLRCGHLKPLNSGSLADAAEVSPILWEPLGRLPFAGSLDRIYRIFVFFQK